MKILVTGVQGFLGSYVARNLMERGYYVIGFDRKLEAEKPPKTDFMLGDIKDPEEVHSVMGSCDRWINLAGLLGTSEMVDNPFPAVEVNIVGALNVFEAARAHKKPGLQIAVGNYWMNNPYSITKNTAERLAAMYRQEHEVDIRIVRAMNVYGPGQKHRPIRKVFPNVVIPALLGKPITIYGDGEQVMDMVYAPDVAEILCRALVKRYLPPVTFEAGAGGITINQLVAAVLKAADSKSEVRHVPMRSGESERAVVEITKEGWTNLNDELGFSRSDLTPFREAVATTVDWYRSNLEQFPWDE